MLQQAGCTGPELDFFEFDVFDFDSNKNWWDDVWYFNYIFGTYQPLLDNRFLLSNSSCFPCYIEQNKASLFVPIWATMDARHV